MVELARIRGMVITEHSTTEAKCIAGGVVVKCGRSSWSIFRVIPSLHTFTTGQADISSTTAVEIRVFQL